ncbi:hypothetical protein U879_13995 [Defluviimonas sp. 20V17]|nr:hypothetical protein U879_13995 [Defluviimonas sp. 20V17]
MKTAAIATVALGTAAPMVMASGFQTGKITAVNTARHTISVNGSTFHINSEVANGAKLIVGEQVLYKVQKENGTPTVVALKFGTGVNHMGTRSDAGMSSSAGVDKPVTGIHKVQRTGTQGASVSVNSQALGTQPKH